MLICVCVLVCVCVCVCVWSLINGILLFFILIHDSLLVPFINAFDHYDEDNNCNKTNKKSVTNTILDNNTISYSMNNAG